MHSNKRCQSQQLLQAVLYNRNERTILAMLSNKTKH